MADGAKGGPWVGPSSGAVSRNCSHALLFSPRSNFLIRLNSMRKCWDRGEGSRERFVDRYSK